MINGSWRNLRVLLLLLVLLPAGCDGRVSVFPEPQANEASRVLRRSDQGSIVIAFASYPLKAGVPPDGLGMALSRAITRQPCSAAVFYWSERVLAERWIGEQMTARRDTGRPVRLILAGHGLGATEASEAARGLMLRTPDAEIVLLLTVDAVKPNRIETAAALTGSALFNFSRMQGTKASLSAYDSAPSPDGRRLWAHINYYQDNSQLYHGTAMPWAENHRIDDWTGLLNHGDADDFIFPLLESDLKAALEKGGL